MQRIKVRRWIAWMLVFAMAFSGQLIPAQAKTILSKPKISRVVSKNAGELKITYKKMPKRTKYQIQVSTDKKFKKVETGTNVKELYELENEINQMQDNLLKIGRAHV